LIPVFLKSSLRLPNSILNPVTTLLKQTPSISITLLFSLFYLPTLKSI
jgi:hypothetical protein